MSSQILTGLNLDVAKGEVLTWTTLSVFRCSCILDFIHGSTFQGLHKFDFIWVSWVLIGQN